MNTEPQKPPPDPELMNRIFSDIVLLKACIDGLLFAVRQFDNDLHLIASAPSAKPQRFENHIS